MHSHFLPFPFKCVGSFQENLPLSCTPGQDWQVGGRRWGQRIPIHAVSPCEAVRLEAAGNQQVKFNQSCRSSLLVDLLLSYKLLKWSFLRATFLLTQAHLPLTSGSVPPFSGPSRSRSCVSVGKRWRSRSSAVLIASSVDKKDTVCHRWRSGTAGRCADFRGPASLAVNRRGDRLPKNSLVKQMLWHLSSCTGMKQTAS